MTEADLADPDSRFRALDGVIVHYKVANASPSGGRPKLGLAMYHGFGANTFSWSFVDRLLSQRLGALVTSHDMPGFGLTQRWVSRGTSLARCVCLSSGVCRQCRSKANRCRV